jgi:hypothetical protein
MEDLLDEIREEHVQIRRILDKLLSIVDAKRLRIEDLKSCCHELGVLWDVHEAKEDHIFNHMKETHFPWKKSILEQHRELRGHWKVLNDAMESGKISEIKVAFDTDGRMLAEKFINHMAEEDVYMDKLR